jgi:hypothetical protein
MMDGALMSQDKPKARKSAQRDAYASGKRFDAAFGLSRLTPKGRGPFPPPVRRQSLQTMGFAALFLLPAARKSSRQCAIHHEFMT